MQTIDWGAVGSIATGLATLVALVTLIVTIHNYEEDRKRQQTTQIRQSLSMLVLQSDLFTPRLKEGDAIFLGSWAITKELRSRLGPAADREDFWRYFLSDKYCLSVAFVGWNSSSQIMSLIDTSNQMEQFARSLSGGFIIFLYVVELLKAVTNDAYSPTQFSLIFRAIRDAFFAEHWEEKNVDKLIDMLNMDLQSTAALYFVKVSNDVIDHLDAFIKKISGELLNLDDWELVKISGIKSNNALVQAAQVTRTGDIQVLLQELKNYISPKEYIELSDHINAIKELFIQLKRIKKSISSK